MAFFENINIQYADSPAVDAFGRLRFSNPVTLFDSTLQYDAGSLSWEAITTGGSVTHVPNSSAVTLSTGAGTNANSAAYQTRQYFRYQPGKSQLIVMTGVMGPLKANVRQRVGYFDANNGLFFEQDGTNLRVVVRTFTGGSASDAAVNQSAWNIDKMDGTGPSGITLDTSKTQIFAIDLQWLGVGRVRFGFDIGGVLHGVHEVLNANVLTVPYMTTANLPCRWEITNTAGASGATTMTQVCTAVISEGGFENDRGFDFTANNGITTINVTTRRAILSIRPAATLNSIVFRGLIALLDWQVAISTQDALLELVYNPTFTGTPTWTAVDATNSGVEFSVHGDAANGAITGGIVAQSQYGVAAAGSATRVVNAQDIAARYPLVLDAAGTNPRAMSIVATTFTQTAHALGVLNWKELR